MLPVLVIILMGAAVQCYQNNTVEEQLPIFKKITMEPIGVMTTSAGAPIEYQDATEVINSNLIQNEYFMDSLTHLSRERIPQRIVHPKGAGAFGHFEVTHDITDICKAKLFNEVGKKTPVSVRFSPIMVESGAADTVRETRGFAVKLYTEEGNFDIVATNVEMFVLKDPILFPSFVRSFKRNPRTNVMPDPNMIWDFLTLRPESLHTMLLVFGDRGIPDGYRYLPGFAVHTFQVFNDLEETKFVKFHILPDAGIRTLTSDEGRRLAGDDPDYATKDLYNAIARGDFPSWTLSMQVATLHDVESAKFDLFDVTKRWPVDEYPLRPVGQLVLNKNPKNYFAEIEQLAFSPSNLVPGILGGVDKLFEARRLAYRDTQNYRLGVNFHKIDVNCPLRAKTLTYNRDGVAPVKDNENDAPNYYPNYFNGPVPYLDEKKPKLIQVFTDPNANNFDQAGELYESMSPSERTRLVENVLSSIGGTAKFLQERAVKLFTIIHEDLGSRLKHGLWVNRTVLKDEE